MFSFVANSSNRNLLASSNPAYIKTALRFIERENTLNFAQAVEFCKDFVTNCCNKKIIDLMDKAVLVNDIHNIGEFYQNKAVKNQDFIKHLNDLKTETIYFNDKLNFSQKGSVNTVFSSVKDILKNTVKNGHISEGRIENLVDRNIKTYGKDVTNRRVEKNTLKDINLIKSALNSSLEAIDVNKSKGK